jgi:hypothetical protein
VGAERLAAIMPAQMVVDIILESTLIAPEQTPMTWRNFNCQQALGNWDIDFRRIAILTSDTVVCLTCSGHRDLGHMEKIKFFRRSQNFRRTDHDREPRLSQQ